MRLFLGLDLTSFDISGGLVHEQLGALGIAFTMRVGDFGRGYVGPILKCLGAMHKASGSSETTYDELIDGRTDTLC